MGISDKNRKILWGRSGNRCAICRDELVLGATRDDDDSVVAEECHIVSGQPNGPRCDLTFPEDKLDSYENRILLCCIHHKMVDDQSGTYTADILRQMKANHENWVAEKLNKSPKPESIKIKRIKQNIPAFLNRLTTGKEVLNIVYGYYAYSFDHDDLHTEDEVDLVGCFLQTVQEWGDLDLEPSDRVRVGFDLTQTLKQLEEAGFYVFGAREVQRIEGGVAGPSDWPVAIIHVFRRTNPEILTLPVQNKNKPTAK